MKQNAISTLDHQLEHFTDDFDIVVFSSKENLALPNNNEINAWKKEGPNGLEFGLYSSKGIKLTGTITLPFQEVIQILLIQ